MLMYCVLYIYYNYIGSSHERMAKKTEQFASFKQQCLVEEKKEPKADSVLIFDEGQSHLQADVELKKPKNIWVGNDSR